MESQFSVSPVISVDYCYRPTFSDSPFKCQSRKPPLGAFKVPETHSGQLYHCKQLDWDFTEAWEHARLLGRFINTKHQYRIILGCQVASA